jgi:hypothetical protein
MGETIQIKRTGMRKLSHRHTEDPQANIHPVSARITNIAEQIQEIVDLNVVYRSKPVRTQVDRSANQMRELRLLQIMEELKQMLSRERRYAANRNQ